MKTVAALIATAALAVPSIASAHSVPSYGHHRTERQSGQVHVSDGLLNQVFGPLSFTIVQ